MKKFIPVLAIILMSSFFHLQGNNWAGPNNAIIPLVFKNQETVKALIPAMNETHQEIKEIQKFYGAEYPEHYSSDETIPIFIDGKSLNVNKETLNSLRSYLTRSFGADEQAVPNALSKMNPRDFNFNPHFFEYGGAYLYPIGIFLKIKEIAGHLTLRSDMSYYLLHPEEMGKIYTSGRIFGALSTIFATILFFLLSLSFFKQYWLALLLTIFFGACPAFALWSHYLKPFSSGLLWVVAAFFTAYRFMETGNIRRLYASAIFAGIAFATLLSYGYSLWFVLLAIIFQNEKRIRPAQIIKAILSFFGVFLLLNPYMLISYKESLQEFLYLARYWRHSPPFWKSLIFFVTQSLRYAFGTWLWAFVCGGVCLLFFSTPRRRNLYLSLSILPGFLYFAGKTGTWVHYGFLLYPLLILAAGVFWENLSNRKVRSILSLGIALYTILFTAAYTRLFVKTNTRVTAGEWINSTIPAGKEIALLEPPSPWRTPPFNFLSYNLIMGYNEEEFPERILTSEYQWVRGGGMGLLRHKLRYYDIEKEWNQDASICGLVFRHPETIPYDWCHPNPRIILWKRK
ncbi:MAG: hypothetical protein WDA18_00755 [Candidatus Ratteibacteria bacterium]